MESESADSLLFREWLYEELHQRRWRAVDLARRLEVPSGTVSRWLSGERQPSPRSCEILANILGVDADFVLTLARHRPAARSLAADDPRQRIIELIERIDLSPSQAAGLEAMLRAWLDEQHAAELKRRRRG
jgi:transcriptional regulator with XRE-family HTH domain